MTATVVEERELVESALALVRDSLPGPEVDDYVATRLEGGWSRHSYVLRTRDGGGPAFVVRVKPPGTLLDTDIEQEYRLYRALQDHPVRVPRVYGMRDGTDNPYGGPYFVLEFVTGTAPNIWRSRDRVGLEADWDAGGRLGADLMDQLAAIHSVRDDRISDLLPHRTFGQLVDTWEDTYRGVEMVPDPVLDEVWDWMRSQAPEPVELRLVHGDFRIGNTLVDGSRITTVLDWELSHWGDPRFDLGYLVQPYMAGKMFGPGSHLASGCLPTAWALERHAERTGITIDAPTLTLFSALGAAVLAVILATGAHQYAHGVTDDIRLAWNRFPMIGLREDLVRAMQW